MKSRRPSASNFFSPFLPIARAAAADQSAGTATFELDQSVELFVPV